MTRKTLTEQYVDGTRLPTGPGNETIYQTLALCSIADHLEDIAKSLRARRKDDQ